MSIRNPDRLKSVLSEPNRLARAFSRHHYGMLAWVHLFSAKKKALDKNEMRTLLSRLVVDNSKHAKLFSARAKNWEKIQDHISHPKSGKRFMRYLLLT